MVAAEGPEGQGTVRARRGRGLAWAAAAWVVAALEVVEPVVVAGRVPVALADPERAPGQAQVCGNPSAVEAARVAGDWEPVAWELVPVGAAQAQGREQELAPEQARGAVGELEAVVEQEVEVLVVPGPGAAEQVVAPAAGRVVALVAALAKEPRLGNG